PDVVGELALGVGAGVAIRGLAGAGDADRVGVEGEVLLVLCEIKDVRVAAGELRLGLLAEGVVPDDPVAEVEPDLPPGDYAQVGGVLVADRQVERAGGLEGAVDGL